jgi:hypothetical protein
MFSVVFFEGKKGGIRKRKQEWGEFERLKGKMNQKK